MVNSHGEPRAKLASARKGATALTLVAAAGGGGQLCTGQWLSRLSRPSARESRRRGDASYACRPGQDCSATSHSRASGESGSMNWLSVPPSWEHADVPPSLKCTPLLRLYPLPWSRSAIGYIKPPIDGSVVRELVSCEPPLALCLSVCLSPASLPV